MILQEEKCSCRSIKRVICLKQKHWSKRWVLGNSNRCPDQLSRQFLTTASTFPYSSKNSSAEHIHAFLYSVCVSVCCLSMWVSLFVMVRNVNKARICSAEERVCVCVCVYVCECVCMCVCLSMWVSEWVCLWLWAMLIKREYVRLRNF